MKAKAARDPAAELIDLAFDFACARPLGDLVDVESVLGAVDAGLTVDRMTRFVTRFIAPVRTRLLERGKKSQVLLGAFLPDATRDALSNLLGMPVRIPRPMIDELVASQQVRDGVRAMLQEALASVIQKGFAASPGGKGLRGALGFGARAAGVASRGLLGGIGDELQRQLEERVRDFVDGGVGMVQHRIAQRMASDDTARMLGKRRKRAFLDLLGKSEAESARTIGKAPFPLFDSLLPLIVAHNLSRAEVREALRAEVEATLLELSKQPLGELLEELGWRDFLRAELHRKGAPAVTEFMRTPGFKAWLRKLD